MVNLIKRVDSLEAGIIHGHSEDLVIAALLVSHDELAHRTHADVAAWECWLFDDHQHIDRVAIIGECFRNETIVRGIVNRAIEHAVEAKYAALLIEFIFIPAAAGNLDDGLYPGFLIHSRDVATFLRLIASLCIAYHTGSLSAPILGCDREVWWVVYAKKGKNPAKIPNYLAAIWHTCCYANKEKEATAKLTQVPGEEHSMLFNESQAQAVLDQLTPLQKDIITLVALPQILEWSDRWLSTSTRQDAVAWGLVRRGLMRETTDCPGEFEVTNLGLEVATLAFDADGAFEDDLHQSAIAWLSDIG